MSLTRRDVRLKLYLKGLGLGFARTATAIAGQAVTDSNAFTNTAAGEGDYSGTFIYIPLEVAANQIREATVVSGATLLQGGDAYAGIVSLAYEVVGLVHPDELNECIRLALRRVYAETYAPIFPWTDGDFASSQVDGTLGSFNWSGAASGTTPTKSAAAAYNQTGFYSLILTNAGYTRSSSFYPTAGDTFVHGAGSLVTSTAYTAKYSLLDVSHGTVLVSSSHTSLAEQHFLYQTTIPSGCYEVKAQLEVTGSGGVAVFDYLTGHLAGRESGQIQLPTWLGERWRLLDFGPAEYGRTTGTNLYNGSSRRWNSWRQGPDYQLYPFTEEASKYTLQINRPGGMDSYQDFWVHGLRPYSDFVALDDETDATNAPEDLFMAAVLYELASLLYIKTEDPKWARLMQAAARDLDAQRQARPPTMPRRQQTVYIPGGRGGVSGSGGVGW